MGPPLSRKDGKEVLCVIQVGEEFVLTIRDPKTVEGSAIGVSYDAFVDDVQARLSSCMLAVMAPALHSARGGHEGTLYFCPHRSELHGTCRSGFDGPHRLLWHSHSPRSPYSWLPCDANKKLHA